MSQQSIFDPRNLKVMMLKDRHPVPLIAERVGISAPQLLSYMDGREIPTLEDVVKLHWYLHEPIEVIIGLKDMETWEERIQADNERYRNATLQRAGVVIPVDTSVWPEQYHTPTRHLDLPAGPRNRLLQSAIDELGYIVEIAKVGGLLSIRGIGKGAMRQILGMIFQKTGEDYSVQNLP